MQTVFLQRLHWYGFFPLCFLVLYKVSFLYTLVITNITLMGLIPGVSFLMSNKINFLRKLAVTEITFLRLLSSVYFLMINKNTLIQKLFVTLVKMKWLSNSMLLLLLSIWFLVLLSVTIINLLMIDPKLYQYRGV